MTYLALIAAAALSTANPAAGAPGERLAGSPSISLAFAKNSSPSIGNMVVDVTLSYDGAGAMLLNLGEMLGNGSQLLPSAFTFRLQAGGGKSMELRYSGTQPGIAGRVDDYIVALANGGSHRVRLKVSDFWPVGADKPLETLPQGKCLLYAGYTGRAAQHLNEDLKGLSTMRFWQGWIESGGLSVGSSGDLVAKGSH